MTRRDYILLAAALKEALDYTTIAERRLGVERAALRIADAIAQDNPKFDRARFLAEVGVEGVAYEPNPEAKYVYVLCRAGSYQQWGNVAYSSLQHAQEVADYYGKTEGPMWVKKVKV